MLKEEEEEAVAPLDEQPKQGSVNFAIAFFLLPLLALIAFGAMANKH